MDYVLSLILIVIGILFVRSKVNKKISIGYGLIGAGCYFLFKGLGISPV